MTQIARGSKISRLLGVRGVATESALGESERDVCVSRELRDDGALLLGVIPVDVKLALEARGEVSSQPLLCNELVAINVLQLHDGPDNPGDLVGQQIEGVLDCATAEDRRRVDPDRELLLLQQAGTAARADARFEHLLVLVVQHQLGPKHLQGALGAKLLIHVDAQSYLPTKVERGTLDRLVIRHAVLRLQNQGDAQL